MRTNEAGASKDRSVDAARARAWFRDTFVPIAVRGLPKMLAAQRGLFCFRAVAGSGADALIPEGVSERYTAMSWLGALRQARLGTTVDLDWRAVSEAMVAWAQRCPELGDAALVLWCLLLDGDARADDLATRIVARRGELDRAGYGFPSMEAGCLLAGLAEAIVAGVGGAGVATLAADVAERLEAQRNATTGLFPFGRHVRRKNFHRARIDRSLGSFASQVYPTIGFAGYARAAGEDRARRLAVECADRATGLQGQQGQWWWIYHLARGGVALRHPVYTVHQDAMGPMMLAAAALADGATDRYDAAIRASLDWFDDRPERSGDELIDSVRGVVWRAVQHDDPHATGRLGLGSGELRRMGRSAWLGSLDQRRLTPGFVCPECRPYHLGWILLADALLAEVLEQRERAQP